MRHLIGFILALVLAAALFFGAGWGLMHVTSLTAHGPDLTGRTGLLALAALLGAGLLAGILLALRAVSPVATGLPGLVLLAWTGLLVASVHRATAWVPLQGYSYGTGFRAMLASGALAVLGGAMVVPLFVPARWRGAADADGDDDEDSTLPEPTGMLS